MQQVSSELALQPFSLTVSECYAMQPFVLLSAIFAALVAFFECNPFSSPATAHEQKIAKVVRDMGFYQPITAPTPTVVIPKAVTKVRKVTQRVPLNLQLPTAGSQLAPAAARQTRLNNLFDYQSREKITYSAELVFDHARGEEITGGKVHIKIPLS